MHTVPTSVISELFAVPQSPSTRSTQSLIVKLSGQPVKERVYHVVACMGNNHLLGVFNNSVSSVERALLERYFLCKVDGEFVPPLVPECAFYNALHFRTFKSRLVDIVRRTATTISLRDVVKQYRGPKYRIYEAAYRSLTRKGINRKDAHLRPFTKFQKDTLCKPPRIINPRSPRYNLTLGKFLKTNEKKFYYAINCVWESVSDHTVIKGLNVREAGQVLRTKWDRFHKPVAIGLDAVKFDMHVSVDGLKYEHSHYNEVFNSTLLRKLLLWQLYNKGVAYCSDGTVSFKVNGTRCSGDLNTSLGNCILMCSILYALCEELQIVAELANNGDDCVLIMESHDLAKFTQVVVQFFKRAGFRLTVEEPVYVFEQIEFCQSHPVDLGGWTMVRNVRTCLIKDPICLIPVHNNRVWRKWLGAVGECGMALVPGCPVLQSFYYCFYRSGAASSAGFKRHVFRNTSNEERSKGLSVERCSVSSRSRYSFYLATGISPAYQIELEKYFDLMMIGDLDLNNTRNGEVENTPLPFIRHL